MEKIIWAVGLILCTLIGIEGKASIFTDDEDNYYNDYQELIARPSSVLNRGLATVGWRDISTFLEQPDISLRDLNWLLRAWPGLLSEDEVRKAHEVFNFANPFVVSLMYNDSGMMELIRKNQYTPELGDSDFKAIHCIMVHRLFSTEEINANLQWLRERCNLSSVLDSAVFDRRFDLTSSLISLIPNEEIRQDTLIELLESENKEFVLKGIVLAKERGRAVVGMPNFCGEFSDHFQSINKMYSGKLKFSFLALNKEIFDDKKIKAELDGVVLPGSLDNYPIVKYYRGSPISLNDTTDINEEASQYQKWTQFSMDEVELLYQDILSYATDSGIPVLATCAGNQHLALHQQGSVIALPEKFEGDKQVRLFPGTLNYYMALSSREKSLALNQCQLPDIDVSAVVSHSYVVNEAGQGVEIGGSAFNSRYDRVIMATNFNNHIAAFQFHPEYRFDLEQPDNPNTRIIQSFVDMVSLYKSLKQTGKEQQFPEIMGRVIGRLKLCHEQPEQAGKGTYFWYTGDDGEVTPDGNEFDVYFLPEVDVDQLDISNQFFGVLITNLEKYSAFHINTDMKKKTIRLFKADGTLFKEIQSKTLEISL